MPDLTGHREGRLVCLIGLVLTLGTLACYWPVCHFAFVNFDDPLYVYKARMVRPGLSWPGVVWAFQSVQGGNWNPLVWLSHMADCQLYGLAPGGHHVTNLLLHTANALLLFLVLRKMTGAIWRSGFAAAIFAWHPLHVESVAWVSERKDVLSLWFGLLTIWAYAGYAEAARRRGPEGERGNSPRRAGLFYGLALFCFMLGLMAKPMLVTLPAVLLLLDYWPLRRAESWRKRGWEKVPFAVLSLAASVLAIWAQQKAEALGAESLGLRLENVAVSYAAYLGKLFWPVNLAVFYPYPSSIPPWRAGVAAAMLAVISAAVIWGMKRRRYLGVGWFWYLGTLVPVIGLVQVGGQAMADRYTYMPYIGLALMVSWGLADLAAGWPRGRAVLAGVGALMLAGCLAATCAQVQYWRNSTALYEHALKVTSGNYVAHYNLGDVLTDEGKLDAAVKEFQEVIRHLPGNGTPYNDLGKTYALQGKTEEAMGMFSNAVRLEPKLAQAHWNLGNARLLKGQTAEGLAEMKRALQLNPDDIEGRGRYADELIGRGRAAEALPDCEAVVRAEPQDAHAHFDLASACLAKQDVARAVANFKAVIRLAPGSSAGMNSLAWIYATSPQAQFRNGPEAVRLAEAACKITQRQRAEMLDTLGAAYAETARFKEAIKITGEIRELALAARDPRLADLARQRLKLYEAGQPYRDHDGP